MENTNLIKIKEVSDKYGITTKTLRYYEEMGLIQSQRTNDYAYRMYNEKTIKRLEQILILRKLNISIKDIIHIFDTTGSEVVLDVLGKKIGDIDEEVSLLHELKEIVLKFIRQIKQADFSKESDIKMLYENAKEIENQIVNLENDENTVDFDRLVEVSDKLTNKRIQKLMDTMAELQDSSYKVSKITKVMDDIARQTNSWAITAAADAELLGGDAGKSFGVTAEEVRKLAQKTAKATLDTKVIIDENIRLIDEAKKEVMTVNELIAEISSE
jgi:DNA-binding transcriptional MerR regulator